MAVRTIRTNKILWLTDILAIRPFCWDEWRLSTGGCGLWSKLSLNNGGEWGKLGQTDSLAFGTSYVKNPGVPPLSMFWPFYHRARDNELQLFFFQIPRIISTHFQLLMVKWKSTVSILQLANEPRIARVAKVPTLIGVVIGNMFPKCSFLVVRTPLFSGGGLQSNINTNATNSYSFQFEWSKIWYWYERFVYPLVSPAL